MTTPQSKFLIRAAAEAGFTATKIVNGVPEWNAPAPNAGEIDTITFEAQRLEVGANIVADIERMGALLVRKYPSTEQQGWPIKFTEAEAVIAGTLAEVDAFQLGIEASITGETVANLAASTLAAAALTGMIPSISAGLRRRLEAGIAAAQNEVELEALEATSDAARTSIMTAFATGDPAVVQTALAAI
ncbi:hypothetical protein [Planktotalea sp.]|uniref:hypothetical protein n=1 Tax=Planktotalea sp. TaxID=2029877 RepID=UPI003D6A868A